MNLVGIGAPVDVTDNWNVASLRPLIYVSALDSDRRETVQRATRARIEVIGRSRPGTPLGSCSIRWIRTLKVGEHSFGLFEAGSAVNRCVSPVRYHANCLYQAWRVKRSKEKFNFALPLAQLQALYVFYTVPRPVVLVSVEHNESNNIFPMDLIGSTNSPYFTFALRSTSPSVRLMTESGRFAVADIPFSFKQIAYDLGRHHKLERIDLAALPFETERSERFGLPVPRSALGIREVEVEAVHEVGSHHLFFTRIVTEDRLTDGPQLAHVQGFYDSFRSSQL